MAEELDVDAKQISVAGSGRLGYSLAPKRWGEQHRSESSDLDFFAVSSSLFESLRDDFDRWAADYVRGAVQPAEVSGAIGKPIGWRRRTTFKVGSLTHGECPTAWTTVGSCE